MAKTRTPGITVLDDGKRFIDKRYLGIRIGLRVGTVTQEQAEERLNTEIARVECDLARKAHTRLTFTDCAARYLAQSGRKRSIDVIKWHVALLQSYIGNLEPQQFMIGRWNPSSRRGLPMARVRPRSTAVWKSCAHSRAGCKRRAFPPKIAKHSSAMPIIQWLVTMRVPMLDTY